MAAKKAKAVIPDAPMTEEDRARLRQEREERAAEMAAYGVFAHVDDQAALDRAKDPDAAPGDTDEDDAEE